MTLEEAKQRKAAKESEFQKKVADIRKQADIRINAAIDEGRSSATFPCVVSTALQDAAIESLRRDGFTVKEYPALSSHPCEQGYTEISGW